ncbi:MAG: (S)-ureidoglycine aminohydrolase [Verrucomicrobiota bacterium]
MNELFGATRNVVKERYALLTPSGFVPSNLPGWSNVVANVLISPGMGADFSQLLITFNKDGRGHGHTGTTEYFVYVLNGNCGSVIGGKKQKLGAGSYAFIPPGEDFIFHEASVGARLLIFQKKYQAQDGFEIPDALVSHQKNVKGEPFLGNADARLQVLLPDNAQFDMAVNIFTYQPGATLPFVETHIMEHGLVMLRGQGVYRLDADYHPVQEGDVIWMAPYCPQWFVAMGKTPASYIYYKDVNRAPI